MKICRNFRFIAKDPLQKANRYRFCVSQNISCEIHLQTNHLSRIYIYIYTRLGIIFCGFFGKYLVIYSFLVKWLELNKDNLPFWVSLYFCIIIFFFCIISLSNRFGYYDTLIANINDNHLPTYTHFSHVFCFINIAV